MVVVFSHYANPLVPKGDKHIVFVQSGVFKVLVQRYRGGVVGVVVYAVLLLMLKGINKKELLEFPKGRLLYRIAHRLHLM